MSPETHHLVRRLFDETLERPEAERMPFLESACAGDSEVFRQVAQLVAAHIEAGHFLEGEPARPQRIGRYVITAELGRGSMGIVYKAIDPLIGREVAVKVIRLQRLADGKEAAFLRERLFREARSAGGLFHPGIVVILDVGQEGDLAFIAMEYVDGPSLFQVLAEGPRIDLRDALRILRQTAAALDFAHGKGIVHRDIKPANIMLEKGVTVKVADFGIAKIASSQRYTKTGVTMGTPRYMSPEQIDAKALDGTSDQFSLAVVAYELLTGSLPFEAESFTALAHTIAYGPRPSARAANPELPASVDQLFYRGLGKLPEERFASCREFVAALEQPLTTIVSEAAGAETTGVRNRFGKPARYIVGGAVAAMLLSGAVGYEWLARKPATVRGALRGSERSTEPPPLAPVIVTFLADPPAIGMGAQATLSWEVGAATEVAIEPSVGKVHAADKVLVKPATSTRYVLTATSAGGTVSQETFVDVRPPSPLQLFLAGESKIRAKQFADGLTLLRRAGELGETRAMMELGEIYWEGREGQNKDEPEALRWFRKAAEADVVQGMLYLGGFYEQGIGVPESPELAVQWYRKAAQRHSPDGTFDLGRMYDEGRGVARDMARARELYQTAARMGNADATKRLIELGGH